MEDNDVVLRDDTVSRYHCKIVQEDSGYVLVDLRSTNGTFVNKVRIREAYLRPGCTDRGRPEQLKFNAARGAGRDRPVATHDRCGDLIGRNAKMREIYSIIEKIAPTDDHRGDRGRDRHRQGGRGAVDPQAVAARARARSSSSTAARCRPT